MKYLFEEFASDLVTIDIFKNWIEELYSDEEYKSDNPEEELKERMIEFESGNEYGEFLSDESAFALALSCNKETLIEYLNYYYNAALEYYRFWEYEYCGFGSGYQCFWVFSWRILSLCIKYFDSIKEEEKSAISLLLLMCSLSYEGAPEAEYDIFTFYELFEPRFNSLKKYIFPDWQAVHPSITWNIGQYYLQKENYIKAREYFSLGAELDYEGRQSIEPFVAVGKNQYEYGLTYYKGLGVEADAEEALKWFELAADSAGEPTIPIIQDMRHDGLLPVDIGPIEDDLNGYGSFNVYNRDLNVYYTNLNEEQMVRLKDAAEVFMRQEDLDYDTLEFLYNIYYYRLYDYEKAEEIKNKLNNDSDTLEEISLINISTDELYEK